MKTEDSSPISNLEVRKNETKRGKKKGGPFYKSIWLSLPLIDFIAISGRKKVHIDTHWSYTGIFSVLFRTFQDPNTPCGS